MIRRRRALRGLSLVELLVSLIIVALATTVVSRAFVAAVADEERLNRTLEERRLEARFEDRIERLLSGAALGSFVSPVPGDKSGGSLVFTTWSEPLPAPLATESAPDFQTSNERFGPLGGMSEMALSTEPASTEAGQRQGIFLREQRPSDSDLTQGGEESVLDERIGQVQFEFFDGSDWQTSWDSRDDGAQKGELPRLVRVSYVVERDGPRKSFVVRPLLSKGGSK